MPRHYRQSHQIYQVLMWGVIWTAVILVCSGTEDIPDQITRIHYGMQFSAMESVRFPQLNFNLNIIVSIPEVALPEASG